MFNDPLGAAAQQKAIFTQLVRLIEATPAGLLDRHRPRRQRLRDHLPHNKQMMIDGDFNGATTPRVYTGSANLTGSSLRSADEAIVRITSASYHARYLSTFYKTRSACGG
ncbi:phospholipase D-like domain-containing protein [Streptomyces chartreusis]|uniref:phospholipase D-like domain-containing protein n=1 Tax=Streptomyces chartreusis TaxID=1969 RepID=UPI00363A9272